MNPKPNKKSLLTNIPFLSLLFLPDKPFVATSQQHTPIADIVDDIILFKDGSAAIVMETTSLNFSLLSEKEQEAVVASYKALINSLSFSLQILVRSAKKDISTYMSYLYAAYQKITNPKLKELMTGHINFITESIKKKNVLSKKFFLVIPFSSLELGVAKSFMAFTTRSGPLPFSQEYVLTKAKLALNPRKDHLNRQMGRLGLKLKQLNSSELSELYYQIYNTEVSYAK